MLNAEDPSGHYLPFTTNIVVPGNSHPSYTSQPLRLITKDGRGCQGGIDPEACFAKKAVAFNDIEVKLLDLENDDPVEDALVELSSDNSDTDVLASARSNAKGVASFKNAANDYYTLRFKGDDTYLPTR